MPHLTKPSPQNPAALKSFLSELSELGRKHGIGVEGGQLYLTDPEDAWFDYDADKDDKLVRV